MNELYIDIIGNTIRRMSDREYKDSKKNICQLVQNAATYPEVTLAKAFEKDFYTIYIENGIKMIKFWGYLYDGCDGTDTHYRCLEYCHAELPLVDYAKDKSLYDSLTEDAKQFVKDISETDAEYYAQNWFLVNAIPAVEDVLQFCPLERVDINTPCGAYLNTEK